MLQVLRGLLLSVVAGTVITLPGQPLGPARHASAAATPPAHISNAYQRHAYLERADVAGQVVVAGWTAEVNAALAEAERQRQAEEAAARGRAEAAAAAAAKPPAQPPAPAPAPPPRDYGSGEVQNMIREIFGPLGPAAVDWGLRVAACESGFNPRAGYPNGPYYGVFQFALQTFRNTIYGNQDPFDARYNILAAAWKYSLDGGRAWGCK